MASLVQKGDPVLAARAAPIPEELFGTPELQKMIDEMANALDAEADGVAIAAPQIGLPYRIFLVRYDRMRPLPPEGTPPADLGVFINPEFIRQSRKRTQMEEGCLSVRGFYGKTLRHERATVRARAVDGIRFARGGGGILAQAFQHEIDHLNGILFVDHATDIIEMNAEDRPKRPRSQIDFSLDDHA